MCKKMERKTNKELLLEMKVGDVAVFPAQKLKTLRSMASELNFMVGRKWVVKAIRSVDGNHVEVTRTG